MRYGTWPAARVGRRPLGLASRYLSASRRLRGGGLSRRLSRYHHCADGALVLARHIDGASCPEGRGSLMALFDRKSKGARSASGAVHVPPTASRHDGNTADRDGRRRRVASVTPASPVSPAAAPAGHGSSAPTYETGSYGAIDARDAEAQVYARRRREQARRDTLRIVAIVAVAVVVLVVVLMISGLLG